MRSPKNALQVDISHLDGLVVVTVGGEIGATSALALDAALAELSSDTPVVLDLVGLTCMDPGEVNLLIAHSQWINQAGGALLVLYPSDVGPQSHRPHRGAPVHRCPSAVAID